jgi:hypothetical protein
LTVSLEPDLVYRWRVVAYDALGVGTTAHGRIVIGAEGADLEVTGRLLSPAEGVAVPRPVVNLSWEAADSLDRTLLFDIYVDPQGGVPTDMEPHSLNQTNTWWLLELGVNWSEVSWAVVAHPLRGPMTLLGSAYFVISEDLVLRPTARLATAGMAAGQPATVEALEPVELDGSASTAPEGGDLEYWFDFGDGSATGWQDGPSTMHNYLKEGTYEVTLTVRTGANVTSEPAKVVVEVRPGKLTSDEDVPGPGFVLVLLAIIGTALVRPGPRRRGRGGDA